MFPFKQIKSSISHQNLQQVLPPSYPHLINSQSQLQIRRERINAIGQYEQPKSTENLTEYKDMYAQPTSSGQPLAFNVNPNYKTKIKKGHRPPSRGGNKLTQGLPSNRGEVQQSRPQQRGYSHEKLEDFSRATSTLLAGFNLQSVQHYQNIKTQSTPEKVYVLHRNRQENQPNWTPNPLEKKRQQNLEIQYKTSPKIYFAHQITNQTYGQNAERRGVMPHETYLLQEIKNQKQTINNFQREVVHLHTQIRQLKNTNQHLMRQYDQIAKEMRIMSQRSLEQSQAEWHKEQYYKLTVEIQKIEKELTGKNIMINYLQKQCNLYNQSYTKGALELKKNKEEHQRETKELTATVAQLKRQIQERKICEANQIQIENLVKEKQVQIQKLKRLLETQVEKLQKQQHNIHVDRSQISVLMRKLQSFQVKTQQLSQQLQQNSKKYQQDIFKQRHIKIEQLNKCEVLLYEQSTELMAVEEKCRQYKQQYEKIKQLYEQLEREKKCVQDNLENFKAEVQEKNRLIKSENINILEEIQAKERQISIHKADINNFKHQQRERQIIFKQQQQHIQQLSLQCQFLNEQKILLIKKLIQYEEKSDEDPHIQCRTTIKQIKEQLDIMQAQKEASIKELKVKVAELVDYESRLKQSNQQSKQIQSRYKILIEENTKFSEKLQNYELIQQQNINLREIMQKYEVIQQQKNEMVQKLQSYQRIQAQHSKLLGNQSKINELLQIIFQLKQQIKELNFRLQNNTCDLNITKNQLSILKSTNKYQLQTIEQMQKKCEKQNQTSLELTKQKQLTSFLSKQRERLFLQLSKDKQMSMQQLKNSQERYTIELQKYMIILEQNEIMYKASLQSQKKSSQLLEIQLRGLNQKLRIMQKSLLQEKQARENSSKEEGKTSNKSSKNLTLSPNKTSNENDTSFVDYVQVDRQGLFYMCEILGIEFIEGGILSRIVEQLQARLGKWQFSKKYADCYIQLLELFGIQQKLNSNELLMAEIKGIKDSLAFLIEKIREEELKLSQANKDIEHSVKQVKVYQMKLHKLKHQYAHLASLNIQLNQSLMLAAAKLYNQKIQTKIVLNIIEDGTLDSCNQISILKSEPFFTIKSFRTLAGENKSETLQ